LGTSGNPDFENPHQVTDRGGWSCQRDAFARFRNVVAGVRHLGLNCGTEQFLVRVEGGLVRRHVQQELLAHFVVDPFVERFHLRQQFAIAAGARDQRSNALQLAN